MSEKIVTVCYKAKKFKLFVPKDLPGLVKLIKQKTGTEQVLLKYNKQNTMMDLESQEQFNKFLSEENDQVEEIIAADTPCFNPEQIEMNENEVQFKYLDCFFGKEDQLKNKNNVLLTESEKERMNALIKKQIEVKFSKLRQFYFDKFQINLRSVDDFLVQHKKLVKEGLLPVQKQKKIALPVVCISQNSPSNSVNFQENTPGIGMDSSNQKKQFNFPSSGNAIPRSSILPSQGKSSAYIDNQSGQRQSVMGMSNLMGKQYQALIKDLVIQKSFRPKQQVSFTMQIVNCGLCEWPKNMRIKLTGSSHSQSLPSLRSQESRSVEIKFCTPALPIKYHYQWRLGYIDEMQKEEFFGPRIQTDFEVEKLSIKEKGVIFVELIQQYCGGNKLAIQEFVYEQLGKDEDIDETRLLNIVLDQQITFDKESIIN